MFVTFDEVQRPVWVVTGASSGVGQAIALEAVQSLDAIVFAIGRTEEALKPAADAGCRAVPLNVAGPAEAVTASLNYVLASVGKIDVLVNAAGYLLEGAVEETSDDEALDVFQTNFFGPLRLIRAVLPHMRRVGRGVIFNIAGADAYEGAPNAGVYGASKAALAAVTEALQRETDPLGVRVCLVQLGHFRTPFLARGHRLRIAEHIEDYDMVLTPPRRSLNALNGAQPGDPRKAARVIVDLYAAARDREEGDDVDNNNNQIPFLLLLGSDAPAAAQTALETRLESARRYEETDL
ncbi:hypothetical protein F4820DRAFT_449127 [Hypoxylon rubiginosum]|uniref:Uncharacterized protein n=1 Tax=Hypoxylon rubiginosum TaxID=110542 RepID=A0ACB9YY49_9PEZI|nr:hypothetical protein F4820DRAFT_449127 [Hypoxylon rubiginosum]